MENDSFETISGQSVFSEAILEFFSLFGSKFYVRSLDFLDLADGKIFDQVLHEINSDYFKNCLLSPALTSSSSIPASTNSENVSSNSGNWVLRAAQLKRMYLRLQVYATEVLKQDWMSLPIPDFNIIAKTTPKYDASRNLAIFCSLALLVAFDCPNRKKFLIELHRLPEASRQILMNVLESFYSRAKPSDRPKNDTIVFQSKDGETLVVPNMDQGGDAKDSAILNRESSNSINKKDNRMLEQIDSLQVQLEELKSEKDELLRENFAIGQYMQELERTVKDLSHQLSESSAMSKQASANIATDDGVLHKIEEIVAENEQLNLQIDEKTQIINNLQIQLSLINEGHLIAIAESQVEARKLRDVIDAQSAELTLLRSERSHPHLKNNLDQISPSNYSEKIQSVKSSSYAEEIAELKCQLTEMESDNSELRFEINCLEEQLLEKNSKIQILEETLQENRKFLRNTESTYKQSLSDLEVQIEELKVKLDQTIVEKNYAQKDNENLRQSYQSLENEILQSKLNEDSVEGIIKSRDLQLDQLHEMLIEKEQVEAQAAQYMNDLNNAYEESKAKEHTIQMMTAQIEELEQKFESLQQNSNTNLDKAHLDIQCLEDKIEYLENENQHLKQDYSLLLKKHEDECGEHNEFILQHSSMQESMKESIRMLEHQVEQKALHIQSLEKMIEIAKRDDKVEKLAIQNAQLQSMLEDENQKLSKANKRLAQISSEAEQSSLKFIDQISSLNCQLELAESRCKNLESCINELDKKQVEASLNHALELAHLKASLDAQTASLKEKENYAALIQEKLYGKSQESVLESEKYSSQIDSLMVQLEAAQLQVKQSQLITKDNQAESDKHQDIYHQSRREFEEEKSQLMWKVETLSSSLNQREILISDLQRDLSSARQEYDELLLKWKEEVNALSNSLSQARNGLAEKDLCIKELQLTSSQSQSKVTELECLVNNQISKIAYLDGQVHNLEAEAANEALQREKDSERLLAEIESLKKIISVKEGDVLDHRDQIKSLKENVRQLELSRDLVKNESDEFVNQKMTQYAHILEDKHDEINILLEELQQFKEKLSVEVESKEKILTEYGTLQSQYLELQDDYQRLECLLETCNLDIDSFTKQLSENSEKMSGFKAELVSKEAIIEDLKASLDRLLILEDDISKLKSERDIEAAQRKELEEKISCLHAENELKKQELIEKLEEISVYEHCVEEQSTKLAELNSSFLSLKSTLDCLENRRVVGSSVETFDEVFALQTKLADLQAVSSFQKEEYNAVITQLYNMSEQKSDFENKAAEYLSKLLDTEQIVAGLQFEVEQLKQKYQNRQNLVNNLSASYDASESEASDLKTKLHNLEMECSNYSQQIAALEDQLKNVLLEKDLLQNQLADLMTEMDLLKNKYTLTISELDTVKSHFTNESKRFEDESMLIQDELSRSRLALDQKMTEICKMNASIEELKLLVNQLTTENSNLSDSNKRDLEVISKYAIRTKELENLLMAHNAGRDSEHLSILSAWHNLGGKIQRNAIFSEMGR